MWKDVFLQYSPILLCDVRFLSSFKFYVYLGIFLSVFDFMLCICIILIMLSYDVIKDDDDNCGIPLTVTWLKLIVSFA